MNCTLMHKNIPVMDLLIDENNNSIRKNGKIYNPEHIPIGLKVGKNIADKTALNDWFSDRCIPKYRNGVSEALKILGIGNTGILILKSFGLSLSDQYWLKPENSEAQWGKINFFENSFSSDMGNLLFGKTDKTAEYDLNSPDNTTDGFLKKRWKIIDGKRYLLKGGSMPFNQQPFNEEIASVIMNELDIPHIDYKVIWEEGQPYSICEDFINPETELVTAWRIIHTMKKQNNVSVYRHYVNCCEALGITNITDNLNQMIVLDYLIANEDRHLNNFGLIRNADSLEWLGSAPIFDSGSSLGYDTPTLQILSGKNIQCKPFKKTHEEQLKLVTSFDFINFEKLLKIDSIVMDILSNEKSFLERKRAEMITESLKRRIVRLEKIALEKNTFSDNIESDVRKNTAENYISLKTTME